MEKREYFWLEEFSHQIPAALEIKGEENDSLIFHQAYAFLMKQRYVSMSNQNLFINGLRPASLGTASSNRGNDCVGWP